MSSAENSDVLAYDKVYVVRKEQWCFSFDKMFKKNH